MENNQKSAVKEELLTVGKGIVGFFDILGYSSFLENNTAEEAANEALKTLSSIDQTVVEEFMDEIGAGSSDYDFVRRVQKIFLKNLRWMVFSDTILLTFNCEECEAKDHNKISMLEWLFFFSISTKLYKKLFDYGLPVRGAIGYGDFVTHNHCFAGIPIIETYKDVNNIELSACVLSESAEKEIERIKFKIAESHAGDTMTWDLIYRERCMQYLIPHKNSICKQREVLNVFSGQGLPSVTINDVRQYVLEKFWKHKKDIPLSAQPKVENTEQFFRFIKKCYNDAGGCLVHPK